MFERKPIEARVTLFSVNSHPHCYIYLQRFEPTVHALTTVPTSTHCLFLYKLQLRQPGSCFGILIEIHFNPKICSFLLILAMICSKKGMLGPNVFKKIQDLRVIKLFKQ